MAFNKKHTRRAQQEENVHNANVLSVISMMKLQNMSGGKTRFWRRRAGSSRLSLMSNQSADSKTVSMFCLLVKLLERYSLVKSWFKIIVDISWATISTGRNPTVFLVQRIQKVSYFYYNRILKHHTAIHVLRTRTKFCVDNLIVHFIIRACISFLNSCRVHMLHICIFVVHFIICGLGTTWPLRETEYELKKSK